MRLTDHPPVVRQRVGGTERRDEKLDVIPLALGHCAGGEVNVAFVPRCSDHAETDNLGAEAKLSFDLSPRAHLRLDQRTKVWVRDDTVNGISIEAIPTPNLLLPPQAVVDDAVRDCGPPLIHSGHRVTPAVRYQVVLRPYDRNACSSESRDQVFVKALIWPKRKLRPVEVKHIGACQHRRDPIQVFDCSGIEMPLDDLARQRVIDDSVVTAVAIRRENAEWLHEPGR